MCAAVTTAKSRERVLSCVVVWHLQGLELGFDRRGCRNTVVPIVVAVSSTTMILPGWNCSLARLVGFGKPLIFNRSIPAVTWVFSSYFLSPSHLLYVRFYLFFCHKIGVNRWILHSALGWGAFGFFSSVVWSGGCVQVSWRCCFYLTDGRDWQGNTSEEI